MELKCGVSKREITPDLEGDFGDFYIAGFATMEAPRVTGIHDPIFVRTIVLSDGLTKIALISLEIVGMLRDFVNQVKYTLEAYGFLPKNVFVFATHTHAGSDTLGLYGPIIGKSGINKRYMLFIIDMIVESIRESEKNLVPVDIFHAYSTRNDLIVNFRDPEMIDGSLHLVKFKSGESIIGVFWTFTAHAEMTNRANTEISADYPGLVSGMIEKEFGGVALYGMGLGGAQSPIYCEHGYEKLNIYTDELYKEIKKIYNDDKKLETSNIEVRYRNVLLPLTNANFKLLFDIGFFDRELVDGNVSTVISKIRIGNLHFVNIPGEPFPGLLSPLFEKYGKKGDIYMVISLVEEELGYFIPLDESA